MTELTLEELQKPLTPIELVELTGVFHKCLTITGFNLFRRLAFELDQLRATIVPYEKVRIELEKLRTENATLRITEAKLVALEAGGVDNWEWYSDSINDNFVDPTGQGRSYWDIGDDE